MRKRATWIGLSLVILTGLLLILLETSFFQQWLLRRVENVATTSGYSLSAGHLDLDLWDLEGTLHNITFDDKKGTRITADRVAFDLPWNVVNAATIVVNNLEIDGLTLSIQSPEFAVPEPSGEITESRPIR